MKNIETAIDAVRLAIAAAEAIMAAMDNAKKDLADSTQQLKDVLAAAERARELMHDQLAKDRQEARDEFDKKFDLPGDSA